jgi:isopentenyl diphosphate isomerase/L-lactate dehydrogenase-like FMN-dependent dehydrogenase
VEPRNFADVRELARRRIPKVAWDFIDGGADDEVTLRANEAAFRSWVLRPRHLRDVSKRDLSVTVFGRRLELPVILSPAGLLRIAHRTGELGAARAAARHGTVYTLTSNSSVSIEDVAAGAPPGSLWFQLYIWRDRGRNVELLERARAQGYTALVVTVDVAVAGKKERDIKNGFKIPLKATPSMVLGLARRPRWVADYLREGPVSFANFDDLATGRRPAELFKQINQILAHPGATWRDLEWLRSVWDGPLIIKGTLTAEDAEQAVQCGVDGISVSNHGGRQLDGVPATIDALPEVVDAVAGRAEIFIDGGVRRGIDVITALALGARAVLIGRPYVFGLAMDGEAGVHRVLEMLRHEIDVAMALTGRASMDEIDRSCIAPASRAQAAAGVIPR